MSQKPGLFNNRLIDNYGSIDSFKELETGPQNSEWTCLSEAKAHCPGTKLYRSRILL